ncbi:hypothetical protein SCLCIDRAFT_20298 [Scleroderma citrinum Foug A]|uniref:Uncharacterized protein n=1 Tax=Scleroderma citrinum Foug A TaxID=1036808 RepID=A0A0C3ATT1_9AGAM|nr:hypothetical protein SCLCIDRAFT_20298 [Scleroderma citrinum Foug A]
MSSGNNTDSSNNGNSGNKIDWQRVATPDLIDQVEDSLEMQIAKFDKQLRRRHDKLMKRVAEQEAQRKAEEERRKAEEEAKRVAEEEARKLAEEEARKLAEEEAKKKAEEAAQKRAKFQAQWKAYLERKAREKAKAKAAAEAMRAQIVQKAGQGKKPKPKPKQCRAASQCTPDKEVQGWYPPCDRCQKSGNSKGCVLPDNARTPMCHQCQKMKVKCYFEVSMATMKRSASNKKRKESETLVTVVATSLRGGEKHKRTRRAVADVASTKEIEEALGGFSVAGPSMQPDPVAQVLDWKLGEVIVAIDCNMRELARLGGKMDGFAWEMKRMANHSDRKGKGRARPEETEEVEEKSDDVSNVDAEGEDADE